MDISANWDAFLEIESDAREELENLETTLKEQPDNQEVKQKIETLKAFFRPYSSDPIFQ